jgi:superfamily II DNA or RNA helicase
MQRHQSNLVVSIHLQVMQTYEQFLSNKAIAHQPCGITIAPSDTNPVLFSFQQEIVSRLLYMGRGALFADTGLGKSGMQWAWSDHIARHTNKPVLLLTPLAVAKQMARECSKFGVTLNLCESQSDVQSGINVTNYEKLHKFDPSQFGGVCADESGILKNFSGKTSLAVIDFAQTIPYRLSASATPAPNDTMEFGTQSEFLGMLSQPEMLATFFRHDGGDTKNWFLSHYGADRFWRWVASWAVMVRKPSDIGDFDDSRYNLPGLNEQLHQVEGTLAPDDGQLIKVMSGMSDRRSARKSSLVERCQKAIEIIEASPDDEQWLLWCELNPEGDYLAKHLNSCRQVSGADKDDAKERILTGFAENEFQTLITKPKIAGFGLNFQNCRNILFVGVNDSYESRYQAIRRCYRFGQNRVVNVHTVFSSPEWPVIENLTRKATQAEVMGVQMLRVMNSARAEVFERSEYAAGQVMRLPVFL